MSTTNDSGLQAGPAPVCGHDTSELCTEATTTVLTASDQLDNGTGVLCGGKVDNRRETTWR